MAKHRAMVIPDKRVKHDSAFDEKQMERWIAENDIEVGPVDELGEETEMPVCGLCHAETHPHEMGREGFCYGCLADIEIGESPDDEDDLAAYNRNETIDYEREGE